MRLDRLEGVIREKRDAMMRSDAMGAFAPLFELVAAPSIATLLERLP